MTGQSAPPMSRTVQLLGYAGLLPQAFALALFMWGGEWGWVALACAYAYAAVIFSFLGGVWWGQALASPNAPRWVFVAAIVPSLLAVALFIPWTLGWPWPGPSLFWLGLFLMASPLVDRELSPGMTKWVRMRWHLSLGLGAMTLILGMLSLAVES